MSLLWGMQLLECQGRWQLTLLLLEKTGSRNVYDYKHGVTKHDNVSKEYFYIRIDRLLSNTNTIITWFTITILFSKILWISGLKIHYNSVPWRYIIETQCPEDTYFQDICIFFSKNKLLIKSDLYLYLLLVCCLESQVKLHEM